MKEKLARMGLTVICLGLLQSCGGDGGCTQDRHYGLSIGFFDSETGLPLCDAKATITDGEHIEEVGISERDPCEGGRVLAAEERPGVYQIVVSKEGYEVWASEEIEVYANACHVEEEEIDVNLVPVE